MKSAVPRPSNSRDELNIWYHTLNRGYRTRIGGETDFPCITDERVGAGRSYVKIDGPLTHDGWCEALRNGRSYVSDGHGHLMDLTANGVPLGVNGSELQLAAATQVTLAVRVACLLPEQVPEGAPPDAGKVPYWTPEHARIGGTREVAVEAIVNGRRAASVRIVADGVIRDVRLDVAIPRSSWVALRILGCAHTNPIFVIVAGRPIRASRRSAEWCLAAVDRCWSQKAPRIRPRERDQAARAFDEAKSRYRAIVAESDVG